MKPKEILQMLALPVALAAAPACKPSAEVDAAMAAKRVVTLLDDCGCEVEGGPVAVEELRERGYDVAPECVGASYRVDFVCQGGANECASAIGGPQVFVYGGGIFHPDRGEAGEEREFTVTCCE